MEVAEPARIKALNLYLARAESARAEAAAASLKNVRDRCLRAEAAWLEMAATAQRALDMEEAAAASKVVEGSSVASPKG